MVTDIVLACMNRYIVSSLLHQTTAPKTKRRMINNKMDNDFKQNGLNFKSKECDSVLSYVNPCASQSLAIHLSFLFCFVLFF